jgi:hypothetical protein
MVEQLCLSRPVRTDDRKGIDRFTVREALECPFSSLQLPFVFVSEWFPRALQIRFSGGEIVYHRI